MYGCDKIFFTKYFLKKFCKVVRSHIFKKLIFENYMAAKKKTVKKATKKVAKKAVKKVAKKKATKKKK